jgi:hypothetical protein
MTHEELRHFVDHLKTADNQLISAQTMVETDPDEQELCQRILEIRKLLTAAITNLDGI